MPERHTIARAMHDIGLAAWFGGSLMGAVGVNGAASDVNDPRQRAKVANAGWGRWTPVNLAAIAAYTIGSVQMTRSDKHRIRTQKGVASTAIVKTALTAAALGATAYARMLGEKVMQAGDVPVEGGTEPSAGTPAEVAKAQEQLKALQWGIPVLTGGIMAVSSLMGEQQRPAQVIGGMARRLKHAAA